MPTFNFDDEVNSLIQSHEKRDTERAQWASRRVIWHQRRLANMHSLARESARFLQSRSIVPLPALDGVRSSPGAYDSAIIRCRAWPMGKVSLTTEGKFVGGHIPFQNTGLHDDHRSLVRLGIQQGDWYLPQASPIEMSDNQATHPLKGESDNEEFEIYSLAAESSFLLSDYVKRRTAILIYYGPRFSGITLNGLSSDY